jgi:hypothetical protein
MDSKKIPFCKKVIFWGQYGPTCWFNAILMAILYSQRSRNIVKQKSNLWDSRKKLFRLLKYVLKYKYIRSKNPSKDYKFFEKIKPEILLKMLYKINPKYLPNIYKKGYISSLYISKLYKLLHVDCLMLAKYEKKIYYDMYNHNEKINKDKRGIIIVHKIKKPEYIQNKLQKLKTPSILIINSYSNYSDNKYANKQYYKINSTIDKLEDTIIYNNEKYILDSIILSNWNVSKNIPGHAIAGITCKNERYVYNGWTRYTTDPALQYNNKNKTTFQNIPCELMKYNWNQFNDNDFCLNKSQCKLDKAMITDYNKNICFSFSKGDRTFIYVRENIKKPDKTISKTPIYISYNSKKKSLDCPEGKIRNPITGRCIKDKTKIENNIKKSLDCPEGKIRNPITGRCIKDKTKITKTENKPKNNTIKKSLDCPEGKIRNPNTGRCIKDKTKIENNIKKSLDCPEGKIRNPITGRCIKDKTKITKTENKPKNNTIKKSLDCPEGKIRNPNTGRCIKDKTKITKTENKPKNNTIKKLLSRFLK